MRKIVSLRTLASAVALLWPALAIAAPAAGSSSAAAAAPAPAQTPMPILFACDPEDPIVFLDAFGCGVTYQAFAGSKLDALSIDGTVSHQGTSSIKVVVPAPGDPSGGFAGGAFVTPEPRKLVWYAALIFCVKASRNVTLDVAGFGNDNTGTSRFTAQRSGIPVTTSWHYVVIPIPDPYAVLEDRGRFFIADGPDAGAGYTLWFDEVIFDWYPIGEDPRPALATQTLNAWAGATLSLQGKTWTTFNLDGIDQTVTHMPGYFWFLSSDPSVASVVGDSIRALGQGTAVITAHSMTYGPATGSITVNVTAPPATAAATPTLPADRVISLFSDAYPNVPVDTWSATWDQANVADYPIGADHTKVYTSLGYAGIEFVSHTIDASAMSRFHMDVWVPAGSPFKVKLVDFGANGHYGGGDDSESELAFDAGSTPPLVNGAWVGLDLPLADFTGLASRAHLAQLILSGGTPTVFVDNIYFHDALLDVDERGPAGFALRGVTPNPSRDDLRVRFSLRELGPVTLAVLDVSGREVATRRVEGLGPGWHTVSLGVGGRLPVGVYHVRLTQSGHSLVTRAAIIR